MKSKYFGFLLLISLLTFSVLAKDKKPSSENTLLWKISGNGLEEPSYMFGTMHVSNKVAFHLGESFFDAIKSVDLVALEINPDQWVKELYNSDYYQNSIVPMYRKRMNSYSHLYKEAFETKIPDEDLYGKLLSTDQSFINQLLYRRIWIWRRNLPWPFYFSGR